VAIVDEPLYAAPAEPSVATTSLTRLIDRWIYVLMAALFVVTALVGFIPTSIGKVMAVRAGMSPPLPVVLHIHAALMGSWLLLLLAQATLMATGKRALHMQLGIAGMVLAPAMVATGFILVPTMVAYNWALIEAAPPEALQWGAERTKMFLSSLVAAQLTTGVLFVIFVAWAMKVRRSDSEMHKRLLFLATAIPLAAAIDRMPFLPISYPESPLSPLGWPLVWIMPMFVWDFMRLRRIHRAYLAWGALYLPAAVVVYLLWWSPGWIAFVQRLLGLS
jgi:hypothetical protein